MSLEVCLPADLRGPSTTITRIAAGLSGAGVHRVETAGASFVLKVSGADEPLASWRTRLDIRQLAGVAGLAPRVVHVDEARRAVLTAFVPDRSFPALYGDPRTREVALALLGRTIRRVHALPLPPQAEAKDPRDFLAELWSGPLAGFALPAFAGQAIHDVLAEKAPAPQRAPVLSHNDMNPTNLVYDGENLLLLDWETAGPNDPFYDLATASVFLRLDGEARRTLFAAYEGKPVAVLPERFGYNRRLAALLCGAMLLHLARRGGHTGAGGGETLDATLSLGDFYQRLRAGALALAEAQGQWLFGLALVREGLTVSEISRYLFLAGGLPWLVLGVLHALKTPLTVEEVKGLSPRDAALRTAMASEPLVLTRRTTLWLTWVGFNLSHSLGAVLFGAVVVLIGRSPETFAAQAGVFLPLAVLVAGAYLAIGVRFWFRTPIIGITWSVVCFAAASVLFLLDR